MALAILSIVGLGAMSVLTGTIESQNKLERILSKGFTHLSYNPKGFPINPPLMTYVIKPGWIRIPSPNAINPQTKEIEGSLVSSIVTVQVSSADLGADTPEWDFCKSDETVRVECSKFVNGIANIEFKLNKMKAPPAAIARVRIKWPSLPDGHPVKFSPEYVITIPYLMDCSFEPLTPGIRRFLEHASSFREAKSPAVDGECQVDWINYRCLNGVLEQVPLQKVCN